jgi:hypothetical protein
VPVVDHLVVDDVVPVRAEPHLNAVGEVVVRPVTRRLGSASVDLALEVVRDQRTCMPDVRDHRAAGFGWISPLDRLEDGVMLLDVLLEQPRATAQRRPRQSARERSVELLNDPSQPLVPGGVLDHAVKEVVCASPLAVRVVGRAVVDTARDEPGDRPAEETLRRMKLFELPVLDSRRRKLRSRRRAALAEGARRRRSRR